MTEKSHNTEKKISVLGLLSIIFGGLSMVPLMGILSFPGLVLGVIGLVRKGGTLAIVGTVLSCVGVATSPTLWAMVGCTFNPSACEEMAEEVKVKHAARTAELKKKIKLLERQQTEADKAEEKLEAVTEKFQDLEEKSNQALETPAF
ncbi:MAG: hypothetical protein P8P30_00285 [Rickettsiales bacterium]|nr:hypothetical protein [Rickettsiales bacterium]